MAAQQWLGEINQFIFVFCTEHSTTHSQERAEKNDNKESLSRKEKVYNKKQRWGEPNNNPHDKSSSNA